MFIKKIKILNYKSIDHMDFDIKKYGKSHTTMFVGKNESGKSNILEAMALLGTYSGKKFDYDEIHNIKDEKNDIVLIRYYLESNNLEEQILSNIRDKIEGGELLKFKIENIIISLSLEKEKEEFSYNLDYEINGLNKNLFIKENTTSEATDGEENPINIYKLTNKTIEEDFEKLDEELFLQYFKNEIEKAINSGLPKISFWKPSEKYLITSVDLNDFKENTEISIPLKHIFMLAGYRDKQEIISIINDCKNTQKRRGLMTKLSVEVTKYIRNIRKHNIDIDIEITDTLKCNVNVKDEGKKNDYSYFKMTSRSEGFKQFISLILSLSIENEIGITNNLILIDEPENHLHPSGIRDLREELLKIGEDNYLFIATHSPFLIDSNNPERNIIIKKNKSALTEKVMVDKNIRDDEVLEEAFGINVYKDLLLPHKILVEGAADKMILDKAFKLKGLEYGITNGNGSNIDTVASRFNHDGIETLVIVDDDNEGKGYKKKIIKIGGVYSEKNVLTLRDIVGDLKSGGTIEDLFPIDFFKSKLEDFLKKKNINIEVNLKETDLYVEQIKKILPKEYKSQLKGILEEFKTYISTTFNPSKNGLKNNFILLDILTDKIKEHFIN